jgi:hypothetical protein
MLPSTAGDNVAGEQCLREDLDSLVLFFNAELLYLLEYFHHINTSILLGSVAELGVRAICNLIAFVFSPTRKSEAGNTGSNHNHSGFDSVGGGICGLSLIRKLRFGIQFQIPKPPLFTLRHLVIAPSIGNGPRHSPQRQRYRWLRRMGWVLRHARTCATCSSSADF